MAAPIWVLVFDRFGKQEIVVQCSHESEAERTIYHNTYYGRSCLKISVKAWRS